MNSHCDVLVVGAGAAGALIARTLAEAGLDVVCLDQGPWFPAAEKPHWHSDWEWQRVTDWSTTVNNRQRPNDYPIDTQSENTLMWNGVGGSTVVYTAVWPRFRPSDFRKGVEHGLAPDWPISYEDLEPFYEATDAMIGVGGMVGDPAIPPRGPFQVRPPAHGKLSEKAGSAFDRLGWHRWPMPVAILGEDFDGRPACNNCSACQSGCPTGAMYDVSLSLMPKALAAGVRLIPNARVERIETGRGGRATGAVYVDRMTSTRHRQTADVVVLCGNGIGTPRLLLLSSDARHPNGLANSSGQVGRNLMHHSAAIVDCWVDEALDSHMGVINGAQISEEFAETDTSRGFVNGFTLHTVRHNGAGFQALGAHSGNRGPWGEAHHETFRKRFSRGFSVLVVGDDLPDPENRVTLSSDLVDSSGLPTAKVDYRLGENDKRLIRFGIERAVEVCHAADGFDITINDFHDPVKGYQPPTWHLLGTARMGFDPSDSVVNLWHQAWDVPNLFIVDGSSMPTGAAVNPTSTISALALRAAKKIVAEFSTLRSSTIGFLKA
ncbi:GMC family oxidoreductase [Kaistia algarum]|uniref:GMC family oxidoreductase n=1 Tax=Kaistia algarum TaxID=2083279 RepID=UPI000CE87A3D|nr:GMC family oxidoreductase [Kaistia algarum]MCX5516745.1 GMC family oxidoreductase [Kaistia algarum]PPE78638.1 GMC family oxidoreductase [Kaistia algarum]